MKTAEAMKQLKKALQKDKEYRYSWVANIAMAYKDNYHWWKVKHKKSVMNKEDLHCIANNAAEYFIKQICDEHKYPKGR